MSNKHRKIKKRNLLLRRTKRHKRSLKRSALIPKGKNTKQLRAYKELKKKYSEKLQFWDKERSRFYLDYYSPLKFEGKQKTITIKKPIGAEDNIEFLADIGEALTAKGASEININLEDCTRVWPSGVMLFCSFLHWTRLRTPESSKPPRISSTISKTDDVTSYLDFCGFHDYVRRNKTDKPHTYKPETIVKIQREPTGNAFDSRFDEITKLLKENTDFDKDEIEQFQAMILGEILINVTEHGINYKDMGWYTLTQVHPTSGFISLNIADNGIGIKNSLKTGPQKINLKGAKDEKYIEEAFKLNVSGAFSASTIKKGILKKRYERGQKRGHGFMYIIEACQNLGIQLTLVSDKAYVQFDKNGKIHKQGSRKNTIFAGTLYNLTIPLKRVQNA